MNIYQYKHLQKHIVRIADALEKIAEDFDIDRLVVAMAS